MKHILSLALALAVAACNDGPTAVGNGVVTVALEDGGIRIRNLTDAPRAYAAYDQDVLAVLDLSLTAFCNTPDANCLRLPANGSVLVPFSQIGGYSASTRNIVVWTWRVVPSSTPGQYEIMSDEAVVLKL